MTSYKLALLLAACLLGGALATAACSPGDTPAGAQPKAASDAKTTTRTASGDTVGVAECDSYLAAYESCLKDKVPAAARDMLKSSFESTRASWRQAASTPEGRAGLANACKTARDTARQAMAAYGCQF